MSDTCPMCKRPTRATLTGRIRKHHNSIGVACRLSGDSADLLSHDHELRRIPPDSDAMFCERCDQMILGHRHIARLCGRCRKEQSA